MKSIITIASLFLVCLSANGQNWNCDTLITIVKNTSHIQIHTYGNLYNNDDEAISLTYTARFVSIPTAWQLFLDDPTNEYTEVYDGSSANFLLSSGINPLYPEKMIFGMNHNGVSGHGQLIYNIYSLSNPSDSTKMVFDILISPGSPLATEDLKVDRAFYYSGQGNFHLPPKVESIKIWSISGKLVAQSETLHDAELIKLDIGNNHFILAEIKIGNQIITKKFTTIH